jgi:DNA gyrase/topoisomerase IV subunit B
MNPEQLWKIAMNPETRILLHVDIEDNGETGEIFTTLMGDHIDPFDSSSRRTP